LHANNKFKILAARVIPGNSAFRLEKHRIDRLRLKFAIEHQECRIIGCEFGADLFPITRGFRIGLPGWDR
jgi:hypothetical protein